MQTNKQAPVTLCGLKWTVIPFRPRKVCLSHHKRPRQELYPDTSPPAYALLGGPGLGRGRYPSSSATKNVAAHRPAFARTRRRCAGRLPRLTAPPPAGPSSPTVRGEMHLLLVPRRSPALSPPHPASSPRPSSNYLDAPSPDLSELEHHSQRLLSIPRRQISCAIFR